MAIIIYAFRWICRLAVYALIGQAILSWFINPYNSNPNSFLYKLYVFLSRVTEPIVRPFRKFLSRFNTGPIDFSIFLAIIVIGVFERVVIGLLAAILY